MIMEKKSRKEELISIPEFFKGKSIFVTGYTGFLGKLIVEKLLYSCPEIGKIYVLIRNKKGCGYLERASEIASSMAFDRLKEKYPTALETKVIPISGDVTEERLGLSEEDEEQIRKEVDIIFYGAASVRFDDPLSQAVKLNTLGTKRIVDLALTMPKLICLNYISTAYTNCDLFHIKEEVYPPKADWKNTVKISETLDPAVVQILCKKYINKMPNTYTFTKSLAEQIINDYKDQIPCVISRPSIVLPADEEPIPGWVDTIGGVVALWIGGFTGIIRCFLVDFDKQGSFVQSDAVVNSAIVSTWKTALDHIRKSSSDEVPVYNTCLTIEQGFTNDVVDEIYYKVVAEEEFKKKFLNHCDTIATKYKWWFSINVLFRHVLPSLIIDFLLILMKKPPMLMAIRRKITLSFDAFNYFMNNTFHFETAKCTALLDDLNENDKKEFGWSFDNFRTKARKKLYATCHVTSLTFLKPIYDEFETNNRRLRWLYIVDKACVYLTYSLTAWLVYSLGIPQSLYRGIIGLVYF